MAFARGHAAFTIDTLKLAKDSLPAAVTEPPPVFPELINHPHPLIESTANDYTLDLKLNFDKSFRALNDPSKASSDDGTSKKFLLTVWKEEWSLLPRELKQASRINIRKPNLSGKKKVTTVSKKKKTTTLNINLDTYEERVTNSDDEQENGGDEDNNDIDENDVDDEEKSKEVAKKKLVENDNEADGELPDEEEEDMDPFEADDYITSYFDAGDKDEDDGDDDGGDGGD